MGGSGCVNAIYIALGELTIEPFVHTLLLRTTHQQIQCKAIAVRGLLRGILELTGEADHADHHLYPA